jgi:glutamate racemase
MSGNDAPIAIFDSGVGGLTVAAAIARALPDEHLIYLGDTARLPYGTKSPETITRYAVQATKSLMRFNPKMIVVACNTASAVALPVLSAAYAPIPVIGVVEPGAKAAVAASRNGSIAVIATEGTVRGGAYVRAIRALKPEAQVVQRACPLFVALAEEGWTSGQVPELAAMQYLNEIFAGGDVPDTLVLGCTHFPVLVEPIRKAVGPSVSLVDSAETVAREIALLLKPATPGGVRKPNVFLSTDAPDRFARVGSLFFGATIEADQVELVDLAS